MEPRWPPLQESAARKVWQEVLTPAAAEMQRCATELASRLVDRYQSELPRLFPGASALAEHLASTEASIRQIAQSLEAGDDPRRVDLAPATLALGRSGAQRDFPLSDLIRLVRLGHEEVWRWLFHRIAVTTETAEHAGALGLATNWLFSYVDGMLVRAEHVYEIEREAWLGGAAAARAAAIDDILTERESDPQRASKRLRYDPIVITSA